MTQPSLDLQTKLAPGFKQMQRLMMSPQMQQALHLLQLPILELSVLIENELEQNPVLESEQESVSEEESPDAEIPAEGQELRFEEGDFDILRRLDDDFRDYLRDSGPPQRQRTAEDDKRRAFLESTIQADVTLFEHLMRQARETFSNEEEIALAEAIVGNFDEKGYLSVPLEEIAQVNGVELTKLQKVLETIHTFEPYGVGGSSVQEVLLIQLRCQNKEESLAYKIISDHYQDLLHNRMPQIQKGLGCSMQEVRNAIQDVISKLDLHPGLWFSRIPVQTIVPDAVLKQEGENLEVVVNEDSLPTFRLNRKYLNLLENKSLEVDARAFIEQKLLAAKWLLRNIYQRNETLNKIVRFLAEKQKAFLINPRGCLLPLTMKEVAEELELHESTIARAVSNKYIDTPRGLLPLRSFFTVSLNTAAGEDISAKTVRDMLLNLIEKENKKKPLSDEALAKLIQAKGITCARRTVAKYRAELNLGNAHQRRQY